MSRIGRLPIKIPEDVNVKIDGGEVLVSGPKGNLKKSIPQGILIILEGSTVIVKRENDNKQTKAHHGTTRALIENLVKGVSDGWTKELEMVGAGYRAQLNGDTLSLTVGFSHPVEIKVPEGIDFKVEKTKITIEGIDKEVVGQISAKIRSVRPPEPYKGKGIKYVDEVVRRKPGKAAKAQGAT